MERRTGVGYHKEATGLLGSGKVRIWYAIAFPHEIWYAYYTY